MGKKRMQSRSTRQKIRQIKPKVQAQPKGATQQKRQRERYVAAGGMLQGYAPEFVIRLGYYSVAVGVACLLVMALWIAPILPYGLPVRIAGAIAWVIPIAFLASFIAPGFRLAWKDRGKDTRMVQGNLVGASSVSTSLGLGMIMVQTRGGQEQYLAEPAKLAKVPGNQVPVVLTVTPNLRHVRTVAVMGQRTVPRPEPPVPEVLRRLRLLPLATPAALALAAIGGDDVTALIPVLKSFDAGHALLAVIVGALLGGAVYGASVLLQRRLMGEVQALMPGAAP